MATKKQSTTASRSKVTRAMKTIRDFHYAGLDSLAKNPDRMAYGKMDTQATKAKRNAEMLRKARVFADPSKGGFTKRELNQLCRLCEKEGYAIGPSHIVVMLAVPKPERETLLDDAIEGKWSKKK